MKIITATVFGAGKAHHFRTADKAAFKYLSMKVRKDSETKTYKALQDKWAALSRKLLGSHQEDMWGNYFNAIANSLHCLESNYLHRCYMVTRGFMG